MMTENWKVSPYLDAGNGRSVLLGDLQIARCATPHIFTGDSSTSRFISPEQRDYNALLISLSPQLLAALQDLVAHTEVNDPSCPLLNKSKALLKKCKE